MWKVAGSSAKYATEEEALKAAGIHQAVMKEAPVEKTSWAPVEKTERTKRPVSVKNVNVTLASVKKNGSQQTRHSSR